MSHMISTFRGPQFLFLISMMVLPGHAETPDNTITRATAAIQSATPKAQSDPSHPVFHITSPAQWMNDPNGPVYHKGFYHLFYQLHPFSDGDGPKFWGHVRSPDLVKWEPLPIALCPSSEAGEQGVWSGCCTINGEGKPMIFYTSVAVGKSPQTHAEQWAALSDDNLVTWQKLPSNPVLSEDLHGTKIYDWRDPFIFREGRQTFMVLGGNLNKAKGGEAVVNIYEAENPGLTRWKYRGVLFKIPDSRARTSECPNFFKLGKQWVLFVSPYGKVQYYVGDFDATTCRFEARNQGLLDYGPNFYAPNTLQQSDGSRIVWGWVTGFPGGHGWNGCLSVPRQLSLSKDNVLKQGPVSKLNKLRGPVTQWRNLEVKTEGQKLALPRTNALEIELEMELMGSKEMMIELKDETSSAKPVTLAFNRERFKLMGAESPLLLSGKDQRLTARIFLDRSVLEIFINDTFCATKVIPTVESNPSLELRAEGGPARAKVIKAWPMNTIW